VILARSDEPFLGRARQWDTTRLPVPADLLVYTEDEWRQLRDEGARLIEAATTEGVWMVG
jgi:uncharacterized protein